MVWQKTVCHVVATMVHCQMMMEYLTVHSVVNLVSVVAAVEVAAATTRTSSMVVVVRQSSVTRRQRVTGVDPRKRLDCECRTVEIGCLMTVVE
jgi:hypothetical protein